jgi:hypothetical protein
MGKSKINDDNLVITRVYKSSDMFVSQGNKEVLAGFLYISPKESNSDVFIKTKSTLPVRANKKQTTKSKYNFSENLRTVGFDDDSDDLEVITIF